ncbi:MAG: phosphoglucosamine mutase [Bacillota bacterium]|jgi:phosphoglucosamine mutase|nr:phosphoglucosamine mutase [Bacillota bacterium]NLL26559.1 phosphoglucosamine mutase [Erysipelotrichia bacterium]
MKISFGTDGIRGKANENLTVDMAYRIGRYIGNYFSNGKALIGRDTRISGTMFESALAAGLTAGGCDVYLLKVCSTPSLVYVVRSNDFDCGLMISASHNPYYDNGIKIISGKGTKIDSALEKKIEKYMSGEDELPFATLENIGQVYDYPEGIDLYFDYLKKEYPLNLSDYKILIDCSNGSASFIAEKVLKSLNCQVDAINNQPNGININRNCGSTHIEVLVEAIKNGDYDCGFSYDGDADRVIAVAGDGTVVDGDKILYCCGKYLSDKGRLKGNKIVTTTMANLGLFKKLDELNIGYEKTEVGDKYVYQSMCENGYVLGGEQSGHIIFSEHATTGDGLLTTLEILNVMIEENKTLNELTDDLFIYPQLLVNVPVKNKEAVIKDQEVIAKCEKVKEELHGEGRVLVRASGTEPLVRVMVEATTDDICGKYVTDIVDFIKRKKM